MPWPGLTILALNLVFFALIGLVYMNAGHAVLHPLRNRWLVYLGQMSYGIELYHFRVFAGVSGTCDLLGWNTGPLVKLLRWTLVLAVPVISWEFIEKPILSLKDRLGGYDNRADSELAGTVERCPLTPQETPVLS